MRTQFIKSLDGSRIAYDCSGAGDALVLLHGGGGARREWHSAGYVARLAEVFTVITLDLRGHGESELPTDPADYRSEKYEQDILAVADACGVDHFHLWGMSFGGKVGRYLAIHSTRVASCILMGTPLGPGVTGELRQDAIDFCAYWQPIISGILSGELDVDGLAEKDQDMMQTLNIPVMLGWVCAMLDWDNIEPVDFRCPTLWLAGSEDRHALQSIRRYANSLEGTLVQVRVVEGLDHEQLFNDIERVLPSMLDFTLGIIG